MTLDKETNMPPIQVQVTINVPESRLRDMLVSAFEGGSNYWIDEADYKLVDGLSYSDFKDGGKFWTEGEYYHPFQLIPFVEGCSLTFKHEDGIVELNREKLIKGISVMAEKFPHHFADFIEENDDAITADVYLQCCCFGDTVYG